MTIAFEEIVEFLVDRNSPEYDPTQNPQVLDKEGLTEVADVWSTGTAGYIKDGHHLYITDTSPKGDPWGMWGSSGTRLASSCCEKNFRVS
jgi:hypothetical protein